MKKLKSCHDFDEIIESINALFTEREFVTSRDIAKYLGISNRTVTNLILKGELIAFKVGREYRIHKGSLLNYMKLVRV